MHKLVLLILFLSAAPCFADIVVPKIPGAYGIISFGSNPFSQTFTATPSETQVSTVSFMWGGPVNTSNQDPSITVELRLGPSFLGPLLGTKTVNSIPGSTPNEAWIDFQFSNPVSLSVGETYMLQFKKVGSNSVSGAYTSGPNQYAGGSRYASSGVAELDHDLMFRVLGVPEPSSIAIAVLGFVVSVGYRRHRRG